MNNKKANLPQIKIGLLWHNYPSDNLGVAALSLCNISILDKVLELLELNAEYFVIGMTKESENSFNNVTPRPICYKQFSIRNFLKNPSSFLSIKSSIADCSIIFDLSEGDSFTDIYGCKRFVQQILSKYLILFSQRPFVFCPQTIGPFNKWYSRLISKHILKQASRIFSRDEQSIEFFKGLNFENKIELSTDLAFLLPFKQERFENGMINVGINISGLLYNGGYCGGNQFRLKIKYCEFVRNLIEMFLKITRVKVHLIPHVISDKYAIEDDYRVSEHLYLEYPSCILAPRFKNPIEAKSYIANLDFFCGSRMHATIAAFSSGVPVVPIAYSRKFSGLFGSLGYDFVVDGTKESTESGLRKIRDAFDSLSLLSDQINRGNYIAQERLDKYQHILFEIIKQNCCGAR